MALALDGHVTGSWSSGSSYATSDLTTTSPNDVIVGCVVVNTSTTTVTSLSTTGVVWQGAARKLQVFNSRNLYLWYGTISSIITSQATTINLSGTPTGSAASVFAISGANTSSILDSNASLPAGTTGTGVPPSVSISTSNANDFIIGIFGAGGATGVAGSGFTLIDSLTGTTGSSIGTQFEIVSSTQSGLSVAFGTTLNNWGIIADAVQAATLTWVDTPEKHICINTYRAIGGSPQ